MAARRYRFRSGWKIPARSTWRGRRGRPIIAGRKREFWKRFAPRTTASSSTLPGLRLLSRAKRTFERRLEHDPIKFDRIMLGLHWFVAQSTANRARAASPPLLI